MKIRVIAIIYTLLILACGLFLWNRISGHIVTSGIMWQHLP